MGRHRLAWPRTSGFQPENPGSNPGGGKIYNRLLELNPINTVFIDENAFGF